jgi:hypothetical protein
MLIMIMMVLLFHWLGDHPVAPGVAKRLKQPKILCSLLYWILLLQAQAVANSLIAKEDRALNYYHYFLNLLLSISFVLTINSHQPFCSTS